MDETAQGVEGPFRVGRKVPRNVYQNDRHLFMAATEIEAQWIVDLLNAGEAASAEAHELHMQAIVAFGEYQSAFERRDELEAENARLRDENARLREPSRDVFAPLAFGGKHCLCREKPPGGCDLIMCPYRKGHNLPIQTNGQTTSA